MVGGWEPACTAPHPSQSIVVSFPHSWLMVPCSVLSSSASEGSSHPRIACPSCDGGSEAQGGAWIYPQFSSVALLSCSLEKEALPWILTMHQPLEMLLRVSPALQPPCPICPAPTVLCCSPQVILTSSTPVLLSFAVSASHCINICCLWLLWALIIADDWFLRKTEFKAFIELYNRGCLGSLGPELTTFISLLISLCSGCRFIPWCFAS